jgi:hypothetical protein
MESMSSNNLQCTAGRREDTDLPELQWLCRSVLRNAFPDFRAAEINVAFYPYIGLTHTIRRKGRGWMIRLSDHCRHAPMQVLEAIVMILGCKVMRRRPRQEYLRTYELFRRDPGIEEAVRERRARKGRKHLAGEAGCHYSLGEIYRELNRVYFNNQVEIARIGWGLRRSRNRMGHYDPAHHTITLSPVLDAPGVPAFVVHYIVYHEMLHAVFENASARGRKKHHSAEFRHAEGAFPHFASAKKFLGEYCSKLRSPVGR